ncbi:MAG: hypothetical protein JSS65_07220 [Armatimonadetes bacterium]|nr:hypothetical protein [Armatimonadota bacterium]
MRPTRTLGPLLLLGGVVVAATLVKGAKPLLEKIGQKIKDFGEKVAEETKDAEPKAEKPKDAATKVEEKAEEAPKAESPKAEPPKAAKPKKAPTKTTTRKPKAAAAKPKSTTGRRRPASNVETG